ncbi:ABC transporter permease subunit [uncultured Limnohabitans sp.]|jgi:putrescine transport system permease protein|uniref:ABC transporter permease n=1 Tax=uncultured Limnohabitans sp. TaxID=768543 RepID=UPI001B3D1ECA|nr:ABC transporter permease subunit [uncultured Limnohabitans sp.]MBP6221336.1 ABC transporter permease subunit [Limnohabitans sp.]MBP6244499.1 ABC transporter permease subunit [Limnohabitans sp.]
MIHLLSQLVERLRLGRRTVLGIPFVWLWVFFAVPFLILMRLSVTDMGDQLNPFASLLSHTEAGGWKLHLKLSHYISLVVDDSGEFGQTLYTESYLLSLKYAFWTTFFCLLLGYPFAYFLARSSANTRPVLLLMVMLPFWTSFLLRVYAWKGILADQGIINNALIALGLITEPVQMLYTDISMLVGMTYVYLPFMVLPLYATLVKLDTRLLEAAYDLGASPWKAFCLITIPLSRAGIVAGSMLVFIPCLGEFVIPSLLGGAENVMIGRVVWDEMFSSNNWPRASALAIMMILWVVIPLAWYNARVARQAQEERS